MQLGWSVIAGAGPPGSNPRHPSCVTLGKFHNFSKTQRLCLLVGCKESRCAVGITHRMRARVRINEMAEVTGYALTGPPHVTILPLKQGSGNNCRVVALFGERPEGR